MVELPYFLLILPTRTWKKSLFLYMQVNVAQENLSQNFQR